MYIPSSKFLLMSIVATLSTSAIVSARPLPALNSNSEVSAAPTAGPFYPPQPSTLDQAFPEQQPLASILPFPLTSFDQSIIILPVPSDRSIAVYEVGEVAESTGSVTIRKRSGFDSVVPIEHRNRDNSPAGAIVGAALAIRRWLGT